MSHWYDSAREWLERVKPEGLDTLTAARVCASLSVNTSWKANQTLFERWAKTGEVRHTATVKAMVARALGGHPLAGLKVEAFAQAIAGDRQAVVIDRWMMRYLGHPRKGFTARQHERMAARVRTEAMYSGYPPRDYQARIWALVRGSGPFRPAGSHPRRTSSLPEGRALRIRKSVPPKPL